MRLADDLAATATLFRAYAASIGVDLAYQYFDAELAALPGKYAPPAGELLLARGADGSPLGCVGLRPLQPSVCEMKRLYVAPAGRGLGLGRMLAEAIIEAGRRAGYRALWLDTLPTMASAIGLYQALGFQPIAAYYDTPIAGTRFVGLALA